MRRACPAVLLCLASITCTACGEDEPEARRSVPPVVEEGEGPAEPDEHGPAAVEDPPPATLVRAEGEVTLANAAVRPGEGVEPGEAIEVPDGGRVVIQLRDGGRVELDGGSRAFVLDDGGAQVILVRGALYAVQPPAGSAPRPPLRVVSSSASVEIGQTGELYYVQFDSGASWLSVMGGAVTVSTGEADNRRTLREIDVQAGQALVINARIGDPTDGPTRLEEARRAAGVFREADGEAATAESLDAELTRESERLDGALRWLETETRQGRELTNQHRAAVREGNTEQSQALQGQLIEHSRSLYRLRRLAMARWERLQALSLRRARLGTAPNDPVPSRQSRVAGLLGFP